MSSFVYGDVSCLSLPRPNVWLEITSQGDI